MVEEARATASSHAFSSNDSASIEFRVADCSKPIVCEGGPFDLVFGAWLLNYAPSGREMADMFRNIALNLKGGAHFVAVTPPLTQDPAAFLEAERKLRSLPDGSGGLFCTVTGEVEDGISFHAYGTFESGDLNFDCYHLRKEVYEAAAGGGGLKGEIKWSVTNIPEAFLKDREDGASIEELESYKVTPHYGMLVVTK